MLTTTQKYYIMYAIGTVESNCTWTAVNYNDPITIGMMQWYGTRAAGLLNRLKTEDSAGYEMLAESLRADVDAHDASSSWWTTRYLTKAEGNSWITAAGRDENHTAQESQFFEDLDIYETTLTGWGCNTDSIDAIKAFIFACGMYHQSPASAGRVIASAGGTSLSRLHSAALNDRVLSGYPNRYNTLYNLLNNWDGESAPPDFGQSGDADTDSGGDSNSGISQLTSQIQSVRVYGDSLVIFGKDNEHGLICYKCAPNYFVPQRNSAAPANPGSGGAQGGIATGDEIDKMQQLWRDHQNEWSYSQGAGRLTPTSSGYSDCSACIWWAVNQVRPDIGAWFGTWTGAMQTQGTRIASGTRGQHVDTSILHVGDIFLVNWNNSNVNQSQHVEWVFPNGQLWGAGKAPLPHPSGDINDYIDSVAAYDIRRIFS